MAISKGTIETTGTEKTNLPQMMGEQAFLDCLQGAVGISSLAVGRKFTTDELISAKRVHLKAFDWVDYVEGAGTADEREVHFTVWAVTVTMDGEGDGGEVVPVEIDGYYQGGTVMNKIADAITANNMLRELDAYGIDVNVQWGKTNGKNKIALVTIVK